MAIAYNAMEDKKLVYITVTGVFDLEDSKEGLRKFAQDPDFPDDSPILVDLKSAKCDWEISEIFEFVEFLDEDQRLIFTKIAIVIPSKYNFSRIEFMELCARNRAFRMKGFYGISEAEEWLKT